LRSPRGFEEYDLPPDLPDLPDLPPDPPPLREPGDFDPPGREEEERSSGMVNDPTGENATKPPTVTVGGLVLE
jgi:hypothetical protein